LEWYSKVFWLLTRDVFFCVRSYSYVPVQCCTVFSLGFGGGGKSAGYSGCLLRGQIWRLWAFFVTSSVGIFHLRELFEEITCEWIWRFPESLRGSKQKQKQKFMLHSSISADETTLSCISLLFRTTFWNKSTKVLETFVFFNALLCWISKYFEVFKWTTVLCADLYNSLTITLYFPLYPLRY
jgi:hypothetical protein